MPNSATDSKLLVRRSGLALLAPRPCACSNCESERVKGVGGALLRPLHRANAQSPFSGRSAVGLPFRALEPIGRRGGARHGQYVTDIACHRRRNWGGHSQLRQRT